MRLGYKLRSLDDDNNESEDGLLSSVTLLALSLYWVAVFAFQLID